MGSRALIHVDDNETGVAPPATGRDRATFTFVVLFAMNLLDYVDRWVLSAVLPHITEELKLSGLRGGLLTTYFLVSYTLFSPLVGYFGDRMRRTHLLAIGVGIWSLATVASGLAGTYGHLAIARAVLGIGEATYGVIAPTILMDLYRRESRARVMSAFYLAMPLGGALGITLGGWIAVNYSWHVAFFVVGAPGLLAAFAALLIREPVRGASEEIAPDRLRAHERAGATREDYLDLMVNSSYTYAVLGMAFYTFAIGGLGIWLPTFLISTKQLDPVRASGLIGLTTLFAAIIGMTSGGWLADRLARRNPRALFLVPGVALLLAVPALVVAILAKAEPLIFGGIFLAEALMFINTGPCNAVIANVVMPNMRSAAYATAIFAVHMLGDIWSPVLMGWVADTFGQVDTMATPFGRVLASIDALPDPAGGRNWTAGMLVVVPAISIAGVVLLAGARHLPREMALMRAKYQAAPPSEPAA